MILVERGPRVDREIALSPGVEELPRAAPVAGSGDFSEYVTSRLPALLRLGHALTGNPHDASDLVQEALEKVGARWSSINRDRGDPDAYVRRVMLNCRTSRWRRHRGETLVAETPDTGVAAVDPFEGQPLWEALRELPVSQRAVIVLRYYEGLSEAEIAATLGISAGTVKSHASRAMATLRRLLAAEDPTRTGGSR